MDLADGGDLQKYINERKTAGKPFTEAEIVKLVANIILGLNELHSNGIQHRDLKPANIVLSIIDANKTILKITDLGPSIDKNTYTPETTSGATATVITPDEKDSFGKEDIWALGRIAYYLSTFVFPFEDHDTGALTKTIVEGDLKPLV
jgi:serine/threonine protein kinase